MTEDAPLAPQSVYGRTKRIVEEFLRNLARANPNWRIAILRYFNPAGAHSFRVDRRGADRPAQQSRAAAVPYSGRRILRPRDLRHRRPTPDGTGVRDYLHVQDLAAGHVAALRYLAANGGAVTLNLGLGRGRSVHAVAAAFESACGRRITRSLAPRRPGDVAAYERGPSACGEAPRMAGDARPRRDLRGCVEVAAERRQVLGGRRESNVRYRPQADGRISPKRTFVGSIWRAAAAISARARCDGFDALERLSFRRKLEPLQHLELSCLPTKYRMPPFLKML